MARLVDGQKIRVMRLPVNSENIANAAMRVTRKTVTLMSEPNFVRLDGRIFHMCVSTASGCLEFHRKGLRYELQAD